LVHTKKLRKAKIKVRRLSLEFSNVWLPLPDSGEQVWAKSLAELLWINGWIWPEPAEKMAESIQIWPNPGHFGQIQPDQL
jgi:hypothetical protein